MVFLKRIAKSWGQKIISFTGIQDSLYQNRGNKNLRTGRRCDEPFQGYHFPLDLPRCHAKPADFSLQGQKAISDYWKATGDPKGMAELTVFYCESCTDFLSYCEMDDEGYFNALTGMFAQALKTVGQLDPDCRPPFVERLETVRRKGHNFGYGVGEDMDDLIQVASGTGRARYSDPPKSGRRDSIS